MLLRRRHTEPRNLKRLSLRSPPPRASSTRATSPPSSSSFLEIDKSSGGKKNNEVRSFVVDFYPFFGIFSSFFFRSYLETRRGGGKSVLERTKARMKPSRWTFALRSPAKAQNQITRASLQRSFEAIESA